MAHASVHEISVCVSPVDAVRSFRLICKRAGWTVKRHEGSRMVHRLAIIMPIERQARTLGIVIESGPLEGAAMQAWSNVAGSAGAMTTTEWVLPEIDESIWPPFIKAWAADLDRAPWWWTFGERSRIGYLLPEFRRSRVAFQAWGCDTKKGAWPPDIDEKLFPFLSDTNSEKAKNNQSEPQMT
jgi:hypothetical protein